MRNKSHEFNDHIRAVVARFSATRSPTYAQIAEHLTQAGIKTIRGAVFTSTSARRIIKSSNKVKKSNNDFVDYPDGTTRFSIECRKGPNKGKLTGIIDTEDRLKVEKLSWHALQPIRNRYPYARAMITHPGSPWIKRTDHSSYRQQQTGLQLHHLIMGKPQKGMVVDHINGDGLDNRKENLRFVTVSENQQNRYADKVENND